MSYNKYQRLVHQVSTDGGRTWTTAVPVQYARGELIERNSLDCQPSYRWVVISDEFICAGTEGYDKYEKLKKQVSLDGGTTWTDVVPLETKAGNLIQRNSVDCGAEPEYKWEVDHNRIVCDGTTAYYALVEYVSYDNRATWTETGNVQKSTVVYQENYPDCIQTVYRWIDTGNYVCVGTSKYAEQKQQVSYNSGTTWQDTGSTRAGSLIETNSVDCGATNVEWVNVEGVICETTGYRWITIEGSFICVGTTKHAVEKEQTTTDGTTWTDTGKTRAGSVIETESSDCKQDYTFVGFECTGLGYDIPTGDNWVTRHNISPIEGYFELVGNDSYGNYVWRQTQSYNVGGVLYIGANEDYGNVLCANKLIVGSPISLIITAKYIDLREWSNINSVSIHMDYNTISEDPFGVIDYLYLTEELLPKIMFDSIEYVGYYEGPLFDKVMGKFGHVYVGNNTREVTSFQGVANGIIDADKLILKRVNYINVSDATELRNLHFGEYGNLGSLQISGNSLERLSIADKSDVESAIITAEKLSQETHDYLISIGINIDKWLYPLRLTTLRLSGTRTYNDLPVYSENLTTLILDGCVVNTSSLGQSNTRPFSQLPNLRTISMIGCDAASIDNIVRLISISPLKDKGVTIVS